MVKVALFVLFLSLCALPRNQAIAQFTLNCPQLSPVQRNDVLRLLIDTRKSLAIEWLGEELPLWESPCNVSIVINNRNGGGSTTYTLNNGKITGLNSEITGNYQTVIDNVIPHEVMHMVLVDSVRGIIPRWLDEGIASCCETYGERLRTHNKYYKRIMPFSQITQIKEYPSDQAACLSMYAQGTSMCQWLISLKGKREIVAFAVSCRNGADQQKAFYKHYGFTNYENAQNHYEQWLKNCEK